MIRNRPLQIAASQVPLHDNLVTAARRYPDGAAVHFFDNTLTFTELSHEVCRLAGWLQQVAGVEKGDRVALMMQNAPQWLIGFYATLSIGGVVVPISPMNREAEAAHYLADSGAKVLICAGELLGQLGSALELPSAILVASYSDYLGSTDPQTVPSWIAARHVAPAGAWVWAEVMAAGHRALDVVVLPGDIAALPYTSGSTGKPKACIHTHSSLMHTAAGMTCWHGIAPGDVSLGAAPMYHVSGLCHGVTSPLYAAAAVAIIPRWDRSLVLDTIERRRVTHACIPPTAVIDMLGATDVETRDLQSLRRMTSGGATMPDAIWARLRAVVGIDFLEAYGMTETAATTHLNPPEAPRSHCLGVPFFGTHTRIVHPETLDECPVGEDGEILLSGPQLFQGYWNRPEETQKAFIELDGRRWLRSGDIGHVDADGYYYMTDRSKRMINASGLKVWPAEIEEVLYTHPAVEEVCVIAATDNYRGETVKAVIVLRPTASPTPDAEALIAWCRSRMAAYKYPRIVEFVGQLPKSPAGKILWRELQEREMEGVQ